MRRSEPAGESGDSQVGCAPKEVHRAALADEARAECFEDTVALQKHPPEAVGVLWVVGGVSFVLIEWNGVRDLVGFAINLHLEIELGHFFSEPPVKNCDGLWLEWKTRGAAVIGLDLELVRDEIEVDLERSHAVRNRTRREAPRRQVQSHVPGMIRPRRLR